MTEPKVQKPSFVATSYEAGVTTYLSAEPVGANAKVLALIGTITDDEIARLTADGLTLLWRQGSYVFLARPEANEVSRFTLSPWARWIAADENGMWHEYDKEPDIAIDHWLPTGQWGILGKSDLRWVHWSQTLTAVNQELA